LKIESISGKYFSNAVRIFFTFQINIPEFQRKSPLFRKDFAISIEGFSVKVLTFFILLSVGLVILLLNWM